MRYVLQKLIGFVLTLVLISIMAFFALYILPSDPAVLIVGTEGDHAQLEILREQLGLNQSPIIRYTQWLQAVFSGDFGESVRYGIPVADLIARALPITVSLAIIAVLLSLVVSIPLGIACAVKQGTLIESIGLVITQLGMAVPAFWLGIMLMNLFALRLSWLPSGGYSSLISLILPAAALSVPRAAILLRIVRSSMLDAFRQNYMQTARAKGLSTGRILYKHALKNASLNILSVAGIHLTQLIGGTIVIEQVFSLPGMGQLLLAAVLQRDLPLVLGLVVITAALILVVNLIVDLLLAVVDPRIRFE